MNKAHRDRIAFMRVVSGKFEADREVYHVQGKKRDPPLPAPAAHGRRAGDYRGGLRRGHHRRVRPGYLLIGDTLCAPGKKFQFDPIPTFAPEHFERIRSVDTMKRKQFLKGWSRSPREEGAIQIFKNPLLRHGGGHRGRGGHLQFDVLE